MTLRNLDDIRNLTIQGLFSFCGPTDITWFIITIRIRIAVKTMPFRWFNADILKKCFKLGPRYMEGNTTSTIIAVTRRIWITAPLLHATPGIMGQAQQTPLIIWNDNIRTNTPTTFRPATRQLRSFNNTNCFAAALTDPLNVDMATRSSIWTSTQHGQVVKGLPNQIMQRPFRDMLTLQTPTALSHPTRQAIGTHRRFIPAITSAQPCSDVRNMLSSPQHQQTPKAFTLQLPSLFHATHITAQASTTLDMAIHQISLSNDRVLAAIALTTPWLFVNISKSFSNNQSPKSRTNDHTRFYQGSMLRDSLPMKTAAGCMFARNQIRGIYADPARGRHRGRPAPRRTTRPRAPPRRPPDPRPLHQARRHLLARRPHPCPAAAPPPWAAPRPSFGKPDTVSRQFRRWAGPASGPAPRALADPDQPSITILPPPGELDLPHLPPRLAPLGRARLALGRRLGFLSALRRPSWLLPDPHLSGQVFPSSTPPCSAPASTASESSQRASCAATGGCSPSPPAEGPSGAAWRRHGTAPRSSFPAAPSTGANAARFTRFWARDREAAPCRAGDVVPPPACSAGLLRGRRQGRRRAVRARWFRAGPAPAA